MPPTRRRRKAAARPVRLRGLEVTLRRFAEAVPAGFPSAAEGYEDEPLNLHDFVVRHPAATFFFRLDDEGLLIEHMLPGSVLVIDRTLVAEPGRLVLIEEDGHFVVCRMPKPGGRLVMVFGVVVAAVNRY